MNDFKNLLDSALPQQETPVDPAADIARGRGALRKRRMTRLGVGASGLAIVAAVSGVLITNDGSTIPANPKSPVPAAVASSAPTVEETLPGVALVAYTGEQVPGYKVGFVPKGWEIQGGSNTVLTIAPEGFKNQKINEWVGKIAVMLESADASKEMPAPTTREDLEAWGLEDEMSPTTVVPVKVKGEDGWIIRPTGNEKSAAVSVTFPDASGHTIVVQGPLTLGWDDAQWIKFAESVKVLKNAEAGRG